MFIMSFIFQVSENTIIDLPTGVVALHMDQVISKKNTREKITREINKLVLINCSKIGFSF